VSDGTGIFQERLRVVDGMYEAREEESENSDPHIGSVAPLLGGRHLSPGSGRKTGSWWVDGILGKWTDSVLVRAAGFRGSHLSPGTPAAGVVFD
jgi:hypothetical protein